MSGDRARPALVAGERVLSWRAWERAAAALERAFDARSIAHGARIACIADTTPALAALLLACARSRRVIVPLNPRLGANDLGFALADADPALVLREDDPLFAAAFAGTDDAVPVSGDPDAGLAIVYTSGSTGRPRGVPLRQRHLVWNAHALAHALALTHDDVVLTAVPMSHIFGLSASTLSALVAGATNVLIPRFRAADVLDAIERERVSVLHGVPTMFALLVEEQR